MDSFSLTQINRYHVYPSFCAPDVGRTFFSHLRTLFASKGITMFNDHGIERGHRIGPEVVRAIRDSQVSIVVLSTNYPSSSWCLDELAEILQLNESSRQIVIPIYYNINQFDVRKLSGSFGRAFMKTCEGQPEELKQRWSNALTYIATIAGEDSQNWDNESDMIQKIATSILNIVNVTVSRDFDRMVGLKAHVDKLENLLSLNSDEVKMIGIWGPAGIGKTTIARALFNQFSNRFHLSCFMGNLEGYNKNDGVDDHDLKLRLQSQLLSEILNQKDLRIHHLGAIKDRLQDTRVFIVIDGVYDGVELAALAKELSWFGFGSRIIVISEDRDILWSHPISNIYYVDFPSEKEAIEILCLYAFKQSSERDGFEELATRVANLCGNLPLGLSVLGSSLLGKSKHEWELQLSRMETSLDRKIEGILRVGYDRLDKEDQLLFIHIACFFNNKPVDFVTTMLASKFLDVRTGLRILAHKSLVQISADGRIVMHSLLQQLGRQIVLQQSSEHMKHQFSVELEEIRHELENETVSFYKSTTIAPNKKHQDDDWYSFCEFLSNRMPMMTPTRCTADDVIDFLRKRQVSGAIDAEALVSRLSAKSEEYGIKPEHNPLRSLAVTSYLKAERKKTGETESILVFSCNDNFDDPDETSFLNSILKELHRREVTPLTYNILGKKNLDEEMLCKSSVGIMILSDSYACSRQSLDHLVEIVEHGKATDLVIIPIYFKVTLSDICGSKGRFEAAFLQLQSPLWEYRVRKWKAAVNKIVSIGGLEWTKWNHFMLAEEVVRNACIRLYIKNSNNLARILSLLNHSQFPDADFFGVWGMAGVGKTSIAREVFRILSPQYDVCYFLQDFYLMCQKKGLRQMRDDFFSKVFGEEKLSIGACDIKPSFMREWFHEKKILLVLDDVSNARDAEAVVGGFGWFSHGHRIILTSRRKQVLLQCKVKESYEIQRLGSFESFRLCKLYLNGESEVIPQLVSCSSGIPLSLEVLGSSLWKQQHINNMVEHLQKLRLNPPTQIQETIRRSFDGLDENEKNIFLDLACFLKGENKDDVVQLLDACGFFTYLGICNLINESLISLVDDRINMPIPFQDFGRFIVLEEDEDPCERSRLWDANDITKVLGNNSGTEVIEGIFLDASGWACELSPTVFSEMYGLRLLKLYCSENQCRLSLPQGLDTLPDELRLLHWENYPLECLPQNFIPENLVEINMSYSNMEKLWDGKKNLEKLKKIKLSYSKNLTDILTLSEALNVEHIDLEGCTGLVDISTSIPRCGKLVSLNMKDCSGLRILPAMVDLTSLKILNLSGCSKLEEIQDFAPNLKELYLAGTGVRELLLSIENLNELVTLDLENCRRLLQLPFGIRNSKSIVELKLSGCTSLGL